MHRRVKGTWKVPGSRGNQYSPGILHNEDGTSGRLVDIAAQSQRFVTPVLPGV